MVDFQTSKVTSSGKVTMDGPARQRPAQRAVVMAAGLVVLGLLTLVCALNSWLDHRLVPPKMDAALAAARQVILPDEIAALETTTAGGLAFPSPSAVFDRATSVRLALDMESKRVLRGQLIARSQLLHYLDEDSEEARRMLDQ